MKKVNNIIVKKVNNIIFIILFLMITICGGAYGLIQRKNVNKYENRTAYKIGSFTLKSFINKEFQDSVENSMTDQIPLAITMKEKYYFYTNSLNINLTKSVVGDKCKGNYIMYSKDLKTFDCDNNIVYDIANYEEAPKVVDERINDINLTIKNSPVPVYVYYIERDSDFDFSTNKKSNLYDVLSKNIKTDQIYKFNINNFQEFKNYFYKTDHHWNYKGSYYAYEQLVKILNLNNKVKYTKISCHKDRFSGSKAKTKGAYKIISEPFCVYDFDLSNHKTYINDKEVELYGLNSVDNLDLITYANYYGKDEAKIIIDYNQKSKENILIIGESYDNAILNLLATHYNKLHSIDLRYYEKIYNEKFDYKKYVKENKIDKILLIGSLGFYRDTTFNLEVM